MLALTMLIGGGARVFVVNGYSNFLVALLPGVAILTYTMPFLIARGGITAWLIRSVLRLAAPSDLGVRSFKLPITMSFPWMTSVGPLLSRTPESTFFS